MSTRQKIKDVFPTTTGLFTYIDFDFGVADSVLDLMFVGNYGRRTTSPMVEAIQSTYGEELTSDELTTIATCLVNLYGNKWSKLIVIPDIEYDPIHNYLDEWNDHNEGSESKTNSVESTRTDTLGTVETLSNTRTDDLTETETLNTTESTSNNRADSIYGFNSEDASNSDDSAFSETVANTGTNTVANTGTQSTSQTISDSGENERAYNESGSNSGTDERDRSGVHSGNIGNLTSQQQIREEIELWRWKFIESVLEDVRDFCTLPIYV